MSFFTPFNFLGSLLICICLFGPQVAKSQSAPGYLGKRQLVELDVSFNPLLALINFDSEYEFGNPIGVGATYRYALTSKNLIGLSLSYHAFGTAVEQGRELKSASSEFSAVVEWQKYGQSVAPLGGSVLYGLGYARFTGPPSGRLERSLVDQTSKSSPVLRIGYTYRYILMDKIAVTPWARIDLTRYTFGDALTDDVDFLVDQPTSGTKPILPPSILYVWRAGVSVGYVF